MWARYFALIALTACIRTNATMLAGSAAARPQLPPEQVQIYRTADQVKGKYEEVALLNSTSPTGRKESSMYDSMRKKAASLGANGIILDAVSEPSAGAKIAGALFGTGAERKGKAIAVYVYPDSTKQR